MLDSPNQLTVEAETVEAALAEISVELGENAEIMRAQKVHRGGVGGFFAKEIVQLTARRRRNDSPPLRPRSEPSGITDVLERMAQDADAEDSDFRTVLERELAAGDDEESAPEEFLEAAGWDDGQSEEEAEPTAAAEADVAPEPVEDLPAPVVVGPALRTSTEPETLTIDDLVAPAEDSPMDGPVVPLPDLDDSDLEEAASAPVAEPAEEEVFADDDLPSSDADWDGEAVLDAPPGMGSVSWSTTSLLRLGLPGPVVSAVAGLDETDDLGWIGRIAATVAPHCGPLPTEDVIVVGPHAERLAEPLGLPLVRAGDMAPYDGSFCAMVEDSAEDRHWLEFVRGGRGIHLVVGDDPWQDLLIDEPVAVSWVGENAVASALYLAFTLGATLGFGTVDGFVSTMVRAQPTDVALAVRRIVGRQ